jgi:hypothetical protein
MTKLAEPSTPSGSFPTTKKATDHELQKHDIFTRYGHRTIAIFGGCMSRRVGPKADVRQSIDLTAFFDAANAKRKPSQKQTSDTG